MTFIKEAFDQDWEEIKEVLESDWGFRIKFFEKDFWGFFQYYFPESFFFPFAPRHYEYAKSLEGLQNILLIGHRESVKTQIANIYVIWCVCTVKYNYILWGGYSKNDAWANIYDIRSLMEGNQALIDDYGDLIYEKTSTTARKSERTKSVKKIHFSNGVFLNSTAITTSTRGFKFAKDGRVYRPELLIIDDVDVSESVNNIKIIEKNYLKLKGQTFGGLPGNCKIVCLGNVISEDGLIPRLEEDYIDSPKRDYYRIPSYIHDHGVCFVNSKPRGMVGQFTRERFVRTEEESQILNKQYQDRTGSGGMPFVSQIFLREKDGQIGYDQNQLLLAYQSGDSVISKDMIQYGRLNIDHTVTVVMGVDPAYSEKTDSDALGITVTYHKTINGNDHKFVYNAFELRGKDKNVKNVVKVLVAMYIEHNVSVIRIESNNGGETIAQLLRDEGLSVVLIASIKDKVTRLIEQQPEFTKGLVRFKSTVSKDFIEQLTKFPNVKNDDMVDSMVLSFGDPKYANKSISEYQKIKQNKSSRSRQPMSGIESKF